MCEHCGCETFGPIQDLHREHELILSVGARLATAISDGADDATLGGLMRSLVSVLSGHNAREEAGIYEALRSSDPVYVDALERGHARIDDLLSSPATDAAGLRRILLGLSELHDHIFTEEQDTYPYAFQTLTADEWDLVEKAQAGVGSVCA